MTDTQMGARPAAAPASAPLLEVSGLQKHFPVRKGSGGVTGGPLLFRLCRECARRDRVQLQVQRHGYEVDAIGEHGKALYARQFHMPLFGHANGFASNLEAQVTKTGL